MCCCLAGNRKFSPHALVTFAKAGWIPTRSSRSCDRYGGHPCFLEVCSRLPLRPIFCRQSLSILAPRWKERERRRKPREFRLVVLLCGSFPSVGAAKRLVSGFLCFRANVTAPPAFVKFEFGHSLGRASSISPDTRSLFGRVGRTRNTRECSLTLPFPPLSSVFNHPLVEFFKAPNFCSTSELKIHDAFKVSPHPALIKQFNLKIYIKFYIVLKILVSHIILQNPRTFLAMHLSTV